MASRKKTPSKKKPTHKMLVEHQTQLSFPIDTKHAKAIQQCLKNGELKITVSRVDLERGGRFKGAYLYD